MLWGLVLEMTGCDAMSCRAHIEHQVDCPDCVLIDLELDIVRDQVREYRRQAITSFLKWASLVLLVLTAIIVISSLIPESYEDVPTPTLPTVSASR